MPMKNWRLWLLVLGGIVLVTAALLPFASPLPDGLERVAAILGFAEREQALYRAPLHDYTLPGLESKLSEIIAVVVGIGVAAGAAVLVGKLLHRKRA